MPFGFKKICEREDIVIWDDARMEKTQVSLTRFLQSGVKIIHIIVQNNTYYSARSRWTKQQHCLQCLVSRELPFSEPFKDVFIKQFDNECNGHAKDHTI